MFSYPSSFYPAVDVDCGSDGGQRDLWWGISRASVACSRRPGLHGASVRLETILFIAAFGLERG
jgi:hypothetical protein